MPLGVKPICCICKTTSSTMWRKGGQGEILCNSCGLKQFSDETEIVVTGDDSPPPSINVPAVNSIARSTSINNSSNSNSSLVRKSARVKPGRGRPSTSMKSVSAMKGKSRRAIFKKNPIKSPASVSTVLTSNYVFYKNCYYQVGDIVSLVDHSGDVYYAQIRGFMQDQFLEKSAVITWLIPTQGCRRDRFDPSGYILGPEEDLPRKLEFMDFVCHAPSDYYKSSRSPYPTIHPGPELCFIWTSIGPSIRTVPTQEEIFGPCHDEEKEKIKSPRGKYEKRKSSERGEVLVKPELSF